MSNKKEPIDQELIRQLALLLNETDLSEIEVERDDFRIKVARHVSGTTVVPMAPQASAVQAAAAPGERAPAAENGGARASAAKGHTVTSPMVGTVYVAPKPGDPPFVQIGDTVREGQTLLIIEAMKHMNQIPAPVSGTVLDILVQDGRPVEYGEALIILGKG